jgi:hypothetical protein
VSGLLRPRQPAEQVCELKRQRRLDDVASRDAKHMADRGEKDVAHGRAGEIEIIR